MAIPIRQVANDAEPIIVTLKFPFHINNKAISPTIQKTGVDTHLAFRLLFGFHYKLSCCTIINIADYYAVNVLPCLMLSLHQRQNYRAR